MSRGQGQEVAFITAPSRAGIRHKITPASARKSSPLVKGTPYTEQELAVYADSLLDSARVKKDDIVSCRVTFPSQLPLSQALADAARARGAQFEAMCEQGAFEDETKMQNLIDDDAVFIELASYSPTEVEKQQFLPGPYEEDWKVYNQAVAANSVRWNVAMAPNQEWAQQVYPDLDGPTAYRQLGQDLMSFMRQRPDQESWADHIAKLEQRADNINDLDIQEIKMIGPGTELKMSVLQGAHFLPVEWDTQTGEKVCVNSPTEEVFTTPDHSSAEGTFTSSRPLVIGEHVINNIQGEMKDGQLVRIQSDNPEHTEILEQVFLDNQGMNKIGELGLVDQSGPIAQSGRTFFNNIIDENAGTHLGFGNSYDIALTEKGKQQGAMGNTGAAGHEDIIIGNQQMDVIGIDSQGREMSLIKQGVWQV